MNFEINIVARGLMSEIRTSVRNKNKFIFVNTFLFKNINALHFVESPPQYLLDSQYIQKL